MTCPYICLAWQIHERRSNNSFHLHCSSFPNHKQNWHLSASIFTPSSVHQHGTTLHIELLLSIRANFVDPINQRCFHNISLHVNFIVNLHMHIFFELILSKRYVYFVLILMPFYLQLCFKNLIFILLVASFCDLPPDQPS